MPLGARSFLLGGAPEGIGTTTEVVYCPELFRSLPVAKREMTGERRGDDPGYTGRVFDRLQMSLSRSSSS